MHRPDWRYLLDDPRTSTDRPKSVRNRCVIEVLVVFFKLSRCFLDFSVSVGAFVIGLSQISSFFSYADGMVRSGE